MVTSYIISGVMPEDKPHDKGASETRYRILGTVHWVLGYRVLAIPNTGE
jgi:hypothetical protein